MTWINYELKDPESPSQILAILSKFKELSKKGHWPGLKIFGSNKEVWIDLPPEKKARWFVSLTTPNNKAINFHFANETDPAEIAAFSFMLLKALYVLIGGRAVCRNRNQ